MRHERVRELLKKKGMDAVLVSSPANIRYISGFTGNESYLYLSEARKVILTDSRYTLQAKEEGEGFQVLTISQERGYSMLLSELLREDRVACLGFEDEAMLYGTVKKLQDKAGIPEENWIGLGGELSALRVIKEEEEIDCLAQAERIGDEAFTYILDRIRPGRTELEVAADLDYFMRTHGAEDNSFDTIVASGYHSAMPHAVPTSKPLEWGDFITIDFGCKYHGYCSDMTRTVVLGKADERQKEIYGIVLDAQEAALKGLCPGMTGIQADRIARKMIGQAGYGEYFGHGLGHSVGLEIHEKPALSPKDETILKAGMIETVEPGIYVPDFGGVRIEDMVLLTKTGCRNLTASPKELIEIR